jgi:uncharacterized damage-inducible protein DinB
MKKTLLFALLIAAVSACAQTAPPAPTAPPANPLSMGEKVFYSVVSHNVVAGAEKMPEENYSFQPTPDVRTFGQLVGHIADANNMFCGIVLGEPRSTTSIEKTKTTKADLVQALNDAVTHCNKAYDGMTDQQAVEIVKFFGRDAPKLTVLTVNTAHTDEHYGNMVTYLRMKGIVPPSSEQRQPAPPPAAGAPKK